jgi:ABC-type multidrug transport system ATPase subunit
MLKTALMTILLSDSGKRFNRDWIFRHINLEFTNENAYAITGSNGSGKSTFLQALAGILDFSEGKIHYENNDKEIQKENFYLHYSFCAPYLELIEEMTIIEFLEFHAAFKPLIKNIPIKSIIEEIGLTTAANKQMRYYSSGMKQRVKLAQAVFSDTPVLFLDEPCSNLDAAGIELYHHLISTYAKDKLIIVSSNDPVEYSFCKEVVSIMDYK